MTGPGPKPNLVGWTVGSRMLSLLRVVSALVGESGKTTFPQKLPGRLKGYAYLVADHELDNHPSIAGTSAQSR
jgi:hypothetical protein